MVALLSPSGECLGERAQERGGRGCGSRGGGRDARAGPGGKAPERIACVPFAADDTQAALELMRREGGGPNDK